MATLKLQSQLISNLLRSLLCGFPLCLVLSSQAFETLIPNPQPFRGYEFEGRIYDLEHYGLLHRFSYLPNDSWLAHWESGLVSSVGSVTSKDFYSLLYFNQSWLLTNDWHFELRAERGEDLDNRYSTTQFGIAYQLADNWSISVLAELQSVKQNDDLQLELVYQNSAHDKLRVAVVATDWVYNKKQRHGEYYTRQPYTLFAEWQKQLNQRHSISGYLNYNLPLTIERHDPLEFFDNASRLEYENATAEINWRFQLTPNVISRLNIHAEHGTRERFRVMRYGHFDREYLTVLFEVRVDKNSQRQYWFGVRRLAFDETNHYFLTEFDADRWQRRGSMLYGGKDYYLDNGWVFSPTLFVEAIDHSNVVYAGDESGPEFKETLIKLSLPFRYQFDDGIQLIVNPTYEVDQNNFGGLNAQLMIRF